MSEVITFPNKKDIETVTGSRTPEQALETVLEGIRSGATEADQIVITWCSENPDRIVQSYLLGGEAPLTSVIGLLEMTKDSLMSDD